MLSAIDGEARKAGVKVMAPLRGKAREHVLAFMMHQGAADHHVGLDVVEPEG